MCIFLAFECPILNSLGRPLCHKIAGVYIRSLNHSRVGLPRSANILVKIFSSSQPPFPFLYIICPSLDLNWNLLLIPLKSNLISTTDSSIFGCMPFCKAGRPAEKPVRNKRSIKLPATSINCPQLNFRGAN